MVLVDALPYQLRDICSLGPPAQAALWGQDAPAHMGEALHKERCGCLHDVVLRFKPGHMQRPRAVFRAVRDIHRAETHKGMHLVHFSAHSLGP